MKTTTTTPQQLHGESTTLHQSPPSPVTTPPKNNHVYNQHQARGDPDNHKGLGGGTPSTRSKGSTRHRSVPHTGSPEKKQQKTGSIRTRKRGVVITEIPDPYEHHHRLRKTWEPLINEAR